jgi:hypothetical protein
VDFLLPLAPGMTMLIGAVVSVGAASIVWRGRRQRWRYVGAGLALVATFDIAIMVPILTAVSMLIGPSSLSLRPLTTVHRNLYVAASRPGPGAPTQPVTVERVLTDDTATYVEYRIPDEPRDGQPQPVLFDDHGRRYDVSMVPSVTLTFGEFLNQLMPWHAPVRERAIFPPVPSGVHFATLRFMDARLGVVTHYPCQGSWNSAEGHGCARDDPGASRRDSGCGAWARPAKWSEPSYVQRPVYRCPRAACHLVAVR